MTASTSPTSHLLEIASAWVASTRVTPGCAAKSARSCVGLRGPVVVHPAERQVATPPPWKMRPNMTMNIERERERPEHAPPGRACSS